MYDGVCAPEIGPGRGVLVAFVSINPTSLSFCMGNDAATRHTLIRPESTQRNQSFEAQCAELWCGQ